MFQHGALEWCLCSPGFLQESCHKLLRSVLNPGGALNLQSPSSRGMPLAWETRASMFRDAQAGSDALLTLNLFLSIMASNSLGLRDSAVAFTAARGAGDPRNSEYRSSGALNAELLNLFCSSQTPAQKIEVQTPCSPARPSGCNGRDRERERELYQTYYNPL